MPNVTKYPFSCHVQGLAQDVPEEIPVTNVVIRRQHRHDGLRIAIEQGDGGQSDHRGRAPRRRFDQVVGQRNLRHLALDLSGLPADRHNEDVLALEQTRRVAQPCPAAESPHPTRAEAVWVDLFWIPATVLSRRRRP